jgi:hypothetical protein
LQLLKIQLYEVNLSYLISMATPVTDDDIIVDPSMLVEPEESDEDEFGFNDEELTIEEENIIDDEEFDEDREDIYEAYEEDPSLLDEDSDDI